MIKIFKQGFSLAELLIVMAIIAIVTAMSFTIAKKGIKNAYNLFFYTGYNGIYEAIGDAIDYGYDITDGELESNDFIKHIVKILSAEQTDDNSAVKITAPNGISYTIAYDSAYTYEGTSGSIYKIVMQIPYQKESETASPLVTLYYFTNLFNGILAPEAEINSNNNINLQSRKDLLPFYIDNGSVGRAIEVSDGVYKYEKTTYYSFRQAYCSLYGTMTFNSKTYVNCSGSSSGSQKGLLKAISPQKIF